MKIVSTLVDVPRTLPVFYIKPDTAIHNKELPLYLPSTSADLRTQLMFIFKIGKQGKSVSEKFAFKYAEAFTLGLHLADFDLMKKLRSHALPWESAFAFDNSAIVGEFLPVELLKENATFAFSVNQHLIQEGDFSSCYPERFSEDFSKASDYFTFRKGDFLALPLSQMWYKLEPEDHFEAIIDKRTVFSLSVK